MKFGWIFRHRRVVLSSVAGLFVLSLAFAARVGFETDVMKVLPKDDRAVHDYLEVLDIFSSLDHILIDVSLSGTSFDPRTVTVAKSLCNELLTSDLVSSVDGRIGLDEMAAAYEVLSAHRGDLFSPSIEARALVLLDQKTIDSRLDDVHRQLVNFPDPVAVRMFKNDPLGLDTLFFDLLPSPSDAVGGSVMVDGWLWSGDGEHLLVLVNPISSELDSELSHHLMSDIESAITKARNGNEEVEVAHLGRFRAALANERTVRGDITRTLWISLLGITLVLVLALGARWTTLLVFVPAVFGGAVALAVLALTYGKVSPIVVGCGSILLGISVDYGVHLVFGSLNHAGGPRTALGEAARPIMLAAMTTGIALMSLFASALPGHRQLGVFAASGVVAAALSALVALPLLLPSNRRKRPVSQRLSKPVGSLLEMIRRRRLLTGIFVCLLLALGAAGMPRLVVETDLSRFNALGPEAAADSRLITSVWGSSFGLTSIVVAGSDLDEALARAADLEDWLGENTGFSDVQSLTRLLPDRKTQASNRERWSTFWSTERILMAKSRFEAAMVKRGFQPAALAQYWEALASSGSSLLPYLEPSELEATPLARILANFISENEAGAHVLTRCSIADARSFDTEAEKLRSLYPEALIGDGAQMIRRLSGLVYAELKKMSLLSFVLVMLFFLPFSKGLRQPLVLVAVLAVTFVWTIGALGWLGVPITMMNSTIAIFVFGLTVDYSIFLLHANSKQNLESDITATAVVVSSLTTILGFGALLLANHPSLSSIGVTTVVGVVCGFIASFLIVPVVAHGRSD